MRTLRRSRRRLLNRKTGRGGGDKRRCYLPDSSVTTQLVRTVCNFRHPVGLKEGRMDIREKIADLQHDQWVGWMKYLFSKCYFKDGCYVFDCPDCGISIDRDLNASLNIRNIGINTVGHTGINACGDGSLEPSLKQEKECLEN